MIDVFQSLYNKLDGYDFGGVYEYTKPSLILRDDNLIQQILMKDFSSFHDRGMPVDPEFEPLSANLISLHGKQWRNLRCKLTPTFSTGKLKSMFEQIYNCSNELIDFITKNMDTTNTFEAKNLGGRYSTNVTASCAFGLQFGTEEVAKFQSMVGKLFTSSQTIIRLFISMNYPRVAKWLNIKFVTQEVETYFINLIHETIKYREDNDVTRNDFLQLFLNLKKQESEGKDMDADREELFEEDLVINQLQNSPDFEKTTSEKSKCKMIFYKALNVSFCFHVCMFIHVYLIVKEYIMSASTQSSYVEGKLLYSCMCTKHYSKKQKKKHSVHSSCGINTLNIKHLFCMII